MEHILLIEDDRDFSEMLIEYLEGENYNITPVYDGKEAKVALKNDFDLILLDLMIPKCDGISLLNYIRKFNFLPVIILTAKSSDQDKTVGFNYGADDYLVKPFSLIELSARIRAQLRRANKYSLTSKQQLNNQIHYKDLEINLSSFSVKKGPDKINLTKTEFEILKLLITNQGIVFSKERIYELIWKDIYYGEENIINVTMNRLRKKLSNTVPELYIKTLWGIGYTMEEQK